MRLRRIVVCLVAFGLVLPGSWASAQESDRGITIIKVRRAAQDSVEARIRWDKSDLQNGGKNELSLSLVAMSGHDATPVLTRGVPARAKQPKRQYAINLNPKQQKLVDAAGSLGFAVSQKSGLRNGLYRLAWVAHAGRFPNVALRQRLVRATRCNPVTSGGSYAGCYYGYTDLSDMDLSNANLTGAYLLGATLMGANLTGATLTNVQYCNTIMPNGTVNSANC